ncbi:MAG: hypothetical protein K2Q15_15760, partial [Burkholderiales bacterium]|nr:hypothetical protein [Burkholderiales bacterium]
MYWKRWLVRIKHLPERSRATLALWFGAAMVGLVAVVLAQVADGALAIFQSMSARWAWWPFFALPCGGMAIRWLMQKMGKGSEGSGIPQAMAALQVTDQPALIKQLLSLRIACA